MSTEHETKAVTPELVLLGLTLVATVIMFSMLVAILENQYSRDCASMRVPVVVNGMRHEVLSTVCADDPVEVSRLVCNPDEGEAE